MCQPGLDQPTKLRWILNGYILNGYVSTAIMSSVLPLDLQSLKCFPFGPLSSSCLR